MDKFKDLADFSMFDGSIPCNLCKGESLKTLLGDHWKCSKCDHIFNEDNSNPGVECLCDKCIEMYKKVHEEEEARQLEDLIKKVKEAREAEKKKPE